MTAFWFFFFSSRRRHTRSNRDWSSDVCSSDLPRRTRSARPVSRGSPPTRASSRDRWTWSCAATTSARSSIPRDRKSVVEGKSVDRGGRRVDQHEKKLDNQG